MKRTLIISAIFIVLGYLLSVNHVFAKGKIRPKPPGGHHPPQCSTPTPALSPSIGSFNIMSASVGQLVKYNVKSYIGRQNQSTVEKRHVISGSEILSGNVFYKYETETLIGKNGRLRIMDLIRFTAPVNIETLLRGRLEYISREHIYQIGNGIPQGYQFDNMIVKAPSNPPIVFKIRPNKSVTISSGVYETTEFIASYVEKIDGRTIRKTLDYYCSPLVPILGIVKGSNESQELVNGRVKSSGREEIELVEYGMSSAQSIITQEPVWISNQDTKDKVGSGPSLLGVKP